MQYCVGTVVYGSAIGYFEDFIRSLKDQDTDNFGVLIVNDNCDEQDINALVSSYFPCNRYSVVSAPEPMTPSELRILLMHLAKERGNELLILGDCDDWFSKERVSACIKDADKYQEYSVFYNELRTEKGKPVLAELPESVESIDEIREYNFLGLSNTAIRMDSIDEHFLDSMRCDKTLIFDWYFFSRLLLNGKRAKKCHGGITYYRLHDNNIAGKPIYSRDALEKEVCVKQKHYALLAKYDVKFQKLCQAYLNVEEECEANERTSYYWWNLLRRKRG